LCAMVHSPDANTAAGNAIGVARTQRKR